jgi:phosphate transport system permease protein
LMEVFRTVPIELKEAAVSLGANAWEVTKHVVLRRCSAGVIASFALSLSKAFGETIAVLMVVGNVARIPSSVFDPGYTLPALIANNYGEMMSIPKYDAALMLAAFALLVIVSVFNMGARLLIFKTEQNA